MSGSYRDVHPVDAIKQDPSKSLRIDYPNGSSEAVVWDPEDGLLWGSMDGIGPFPLYEPDVRTVCEKYDVAVRDERSLHTGSEHE